MLNTETYLLRVQTTPLIMAMLLATLGGIYLLMGWKVFRWLVVLNALVLGMLAGHWLGMRVQRYPNMPLILALAGGVVAAAAAWPLMKGAVSLMGALVGSAAGFALWRHIATAAATSPETSMAHLAWIGGLIGFILMGLLAFIIFKFVVVVFTALQGSFMMITGLLAVAMAHESLRGPIHNQLLANTYLLPLLVIVPAILGSIFQQTKYGRGGGGGATGGGKTK